MAGSGHPNAGASIGSALALIVRLTLKSHWQRYVEGCERVGRKADPANWSVAKSIFAADDDNVARTHATDPDSPYRYYYPRSMPSSPAAAATTCSRPRASSRIPR